jgi:hypothetical protein
MTTGVLVDSYLRVLDQLELEESGLRKALARLNYDKCAIFYEPAMDPYRDSSITAGAPAPAIDTILPVTSQQKVGAPIKAGGKNVDCSSNLI